MAVLGGDWDYEFADAGLPVIYTVKPSDGLQDSLGNMKGNCLFSMTVYAINLPRDADEYTGTALSLNGMSVDKAAERWLHGLNVRGKESLLQADLAFPASYWGSCSLSFMMMKG